MVSHKIIIIDNSIESKIESRMDKFINNSDKKTISTDKTNITIKKKYHNLVLSGGSVRGISLLGSIHKLIETELIDLAKLKAIAGTSVGALVGCLIVLGFTIDEIWNFIKSITMSKLVKPDFLLFMNKCGVDSGSIIHNLIEEILLKKTNVPNITFIKLFNLTNISFTVVGSCLTTKIATYFNHINTPDFIVSKAIRISISIPGFFTPVIEQVSDQELKYVDGGVIDNFPIKIFDTDIVNTIGILICNEYETNYKYPEQYPLAIMNLFMYNYYKETYDKYIDNTILINDCIENSSFFNFNVDDKLKKELYDNGIKATERFIIRHNFEKKSSKPNPADQILTRFFTGHDCISSINTDFF